MEPVPLRNKFRLKQTIKHVRIKRVGLLDFWAELNAFGVEIVSTNYVIFSHFQSLTLHTFLIHGSLETGQTVCKKTIN